MNDDINDVRHTSTLAKFEESVRRSSPGIEDPLLVPCPLCNGSAVSVRAVWVYEHGCAFGHYDSEEDPCPECEGNGQTLVDGEPITLEDMEEAYG